MINGVEIPVLTPFKFYPVDVTLNNGVNFQNVDNTELHEQDWEGVYPSRFIQPVPRFWNDYTPGIDFQIYLDTSVLAFADLKVAIIDLTGTIVQALTTTDFFTYSGTLKQINICADELRIDDGCYRIKIYEDNGDDMYYSEVISIADTHDDCYPLEYSNFENDFGLIFTNASAEIWRGKMLIPLRLFKPVPEEEREVYNNDVGELTTLRVIPKRVYELQSFPVSTWFTEKIKLIFGCSDLTLNKLSVNTEEGIEPNIISESDKMEFTGNIQMNDFTNGYWQEAQIDTVTELIIDWSTTSGNWSAFSNVFSRIVGAVSTGVATAETNSFSLVTDAWYLIEFTPSASAVLVGVELHIDGNTFLLTNVGKNTYVFQSVSTGSDVIELETQSGSSFDCLCSLNKIS